MRLLYRCPPRAPPPIMNAKSLYNMLFLKTIKRDMQTISLGKVFMRRRTFAIISATQKRSEIRGVRLKIKEKR